MSLLGYFKMERGQLLDMEKLILKKLRFRLNAPTPYVFMLRFLKASQADKRTTLVSSFSSVTTLLSGHWPDLVRYIIPYLSTTAELSVWGKSCADMILRFQKAAGRGLLKVTFEKYLSTDRNAEDLMKPVVVRISMTRYSKEGEKLYLYNSNVPNVKDQNIKQQHKDYFKGLETGPPHPQ
ncbi:hypothetical protein ACLOJK_021857 [Asimina triloba]